MSEACLYLNPAASATVRDLVAEYLSDVPQVSAAHITELVGGFEDGKLPALTDYAVVFVDESGNVNLIGEE
jgi:hypothetical protein